MLKAIHVLTVVVSLSLFIFRGLWMQTQSPMLRKRWVKILPHLNDTVLLASAVALAVMIEQYPFVDAWLTAKVIGLIIYILLGMLALHWGKTANVRNTAWIFGLVTFLYIISVAILKTPYGFLIHMM
jgi:uncharacterized membrane protein SirB2